MGDKNKLERECIVLGEINRGEIHCLGVKNKLGRECIVLREKFFLEGMYITLGDTNKLDETALFWGEKKINERKTTLLKKKKKETTSCLRREI